MTPASFFDSEVATFVCRKFSYLLIYLKRHTAGKSLKTSCKFWLNYNRSKLKSVVWLSKFQFKYFSSHADTGRQRRSNVNKRWTSPNSATLKPTMFAFNILIGWSSSEFALTSVACQSPMPVILAGTTARATDPITTDRVVSGRDRHREIWKCPTIKLSTTSTSESVNFLVFT